MSLNISGSMYVRISSLPAIKPRISKSWMFADLTTSRPTGAWKVNKVTGELLINPKNGEYIEERAYSDWKGKFVDKAFVDAENLSVGDYINITKGLVVAEKYKGADGKEHISHEVTIFEFTIAGVEEGTDTDTNEMEEE